MTEKSTKIIKRYQNRKLYDTRDSCYVTLEEIGDMIRQGEDLRVIDNNSKEDLTSMTLAQIILEEQKKKTNVLPLGMFRQIIQGGGIAIRDLVTIGAREIGHVKEFVDDKVKPAVENLQKIPAVHADVDSIKKRLDAFEGRMAAIESHFKNSKK